MTLRNEVDWSSVAPFRVEYGRICCFHEAVVAEVSMAAVEALVQDELFLPHLTLGYVREPHDAEPLRQALAPLCETTLGAATARSVSHVRVPISKSTFLEPWSVLETVALEPPR